MRTYTVLCVSDHVDPLVYSNSIKERFSHIDLVLGAGDLDLPYYGYIVSMLNKPLAFVFGNHNLKRISSYRKEYRIGMISWSMINENQDNDDFIERSFGATYVGDKTINFHGLLIAGLGGSRRYNKGYNQFNEFQMFLKTLKLFPGLLLNRILYDRWLDILLTHAPPKDIHDREDRCHRGFTIFRWIMKLFKPQYLIHGHVHLYDLNEKRRTHFEKTLVVNAYEHTLIEIEVD